MAEPRRLLGAALTALALLLAVAGPAAAQQVLRIAAVVNDDIISALDLGERVRLVILSSGLKDEPATARRLAPDVLRVLIDERLQLQEAARLSITVSDDEIERAVAAVERQAQMPKGGLEEFLRRGQLRKAVVEGQLRAELAWRKVIQRRLRAAAVVGEDEIDDALRRLRESQGKTQSLLSEILLPIERADQEAETRERATALVSELRNGANFAAIARQFSAGVTAAQGGDIGWVLPDQTDNEVEQAIATLRPGEISMPIRTPSGWQIVYLRDRRVVGGRESGTVVDLRQVAVPLPRDATEADQRARAAELSRSTGTLRGCDAITAAAERLGVAGTANLGKVKESELPDELRRVIAKLQVGVPSEPMPARGLLRVLMVCARDEGGGEGDAKLPSRTEIADRLMQNRVELQARRYLRDLRRAAVVDVRI